MSDAPTTAGTRAVDWVALEGAAHEARVRARAPYSNYTVGSAGVSVDGRVFAGCNVENAAYLALHAEWGMIQAAVLGGATVVAMVCVTAEGVSVPCGICRQVLYEHSGPGLLVATKKGPVLLEDLLPFAFSKTALSDRCIDTRVPARTAGVVVLRGDEVLLVRPGEASHHERDVWVLPAGHLDDGESYLEAAIRETEEETGLVVAPEDLTELPRVYVADLRRRDGSTESMTWTVFTTRRFSGELRETPEAAPVWMALSALDDLKLQGNTADAIAQALYVLG